MGTSRAAGGIVLTVALLGTFGCGSDGAKKPSVSERLYVAAVTTADPRAFIGVDSAVLVEEGHRLCDVLRKGDQAAAVAEARRRYPQHEAEVLTAGAPALCPDQTNKINFTIRIPISTPGH
jgi:hypothetical protein